MKLPALILAILLSAPAWGAIPWMEYKVPGAINSRGILQDVLSHCDAQGRQTAYELDQMTWCHEATHQLNSRIRQSAGGTGTVNAFYCGGDKCVILREPRTTLATVARYVSPQYRDQLFRTYFVADWNSEPLYILDEFSAYANGLQFCRETNARDCQGTDKFAAQFCHYADCVVAAVRDNDPNYSELTELTEFVDWQKNRVAQLNGAPQSLSQCSSCNGGSCSTGNYGSYQQPYRIISKPVETQPIQPQSTRNTDVDNAWKKWSEEVNAKLAALESQKPKDGATPTVNYQQLSASLDYSKFRVTVDAPKPTGKDFDQWVPEIQSRLPPIYLKAPDDAKAVAVHLGREWDFTLDKLQGKQR